MIILYGSFQDFLLINKDRVAKFSLPFHTPLAGLKFLSFLINLLQLY